MYTHVEQLHSHTLKVSLQYVSEFCFVVNAAADVVVVVTVVLNT